MEEHSQRTCATLPRTRHTSQATKHALTGQQTNSLAHAALSRVCTPTTTFITTTAATATTTATTTDRRFAPFPPPAARV